MEEKISSELILADSRIDSFRRSLGQLHTFASSFLSLNLQWQELEDHYASMRDEVTQRLEEVRSVEEKLEDIGRREGELNALRDSTEERLREVEAREREFELIQEKEIEELKVEFELIEKSRREIEALSESIEAKRRLVEEKEGSVRETEKQVGVALKEMEIKEEECAKLRDELKVKEERIVERSKILAMENDRLSRWALELESKGKGIEEERKECSKLGNELKQREEQIEERSKMVAVEGDRLSRWELDLNSKGKELEEKRKESALEAEKLELKRKLIQDKCEKVKQDEKKLVERFQEVELKEKRIQDKCEKVELEVKKLKERIREVELKEKMSQKVQMEKKKLEQQGKEVELEEKLAERCREVESKEKRNQEMCEKFEMEKKKLAQQCQEVESKQKELDQKCSEFESKEREPFDDNRKPFAVNYAKDNQADANLHFVVFMDGKALQIFLNEHCQDFDSIRNYVLVALGFSSDPAKLVLEAMQGFYPPHLKNSDKDFETEVVRRSCILLLEQLMKISPVIRPPVKKEAMRLARDWITKMKADAEHSLEVLAFLHVLASYGLASIFDANELLTYMEIVALHSQAPKLFRVLGFANKVYGFVRNLIEKKQQIAAIRFIHAFKLFKLFPDGPLLNEFLMDSKNACKRLRKACGSLEGQIEAANQRIFDIRQALKCIEECNTRCRSSPKQLMQMIESLERENSKRKAELLLGPEMQNSQFNQKTHLSPAVVDRDIPVLNYATSSASPSLMSTAENQPKQLSGNKRPRIEELGEKSSNTRPSDADQCDLLSTSMDVSAPLDLQPNPKRLFVNTNKEDSELTRDDGNIAADLQYAFDPGKLVLDVINICFPFKLEGNTNFKLHIPKKCCSLLLDQLRNVHFEIRPEVQEQARKFAIQWEYMQENKRSDPLDVNCFLQFLLAFKLGSYFDAEKLLGLLLSLLDTEYWCKASPELCRDLNLTEVIPSFIQKQTSRGRHNEAIKYIYALTIVDSFPALPVLKNHLINSSIAMQQGDIENEIKALKDAIKCIYDFRTTGVSPENLRVRIAQLEREKAKPDKPKSAVEVEHRDKEKPKPVLPVSQGVQHGSTTEQPEQANPAQPAQQHQPVFPANPPSHSAPLRPVQQPEVSFTLQGHCPAAQPPLPPYPRLPSQQPQPGLHTSPGSPYINAAPGPGLEPCGPKQPPMHQPGSYMGQGVPSLYNNPHIQQWWDLYNMQFNHL